MIILTIVKSVEFAGEIDEQHKTSFRHKIIISIYSLQPISIFHIHRRLLLESHI